MLGKRSRLHLERLEAREVPAALSTVAPPVLAVTVAPAVPVAPVVNPNSVAIGVQLANPAFMSPTSPIYVPISQPLAPVYFDTTINGKFPLTWLANPMV